MKKMVIHGDFERYRTELEAVERLFEASTQSIHKARNELRIAMLGDERVVIKAFRIPNLLNRIVYAWLRPSKTAKSYANALHLLALGIDTPHPVAVIEERAWGLFGRSYFVSLHYRYDATIREALHRKMEDYREVLEAFAAFTYGLHVKGIWHEDYSPGNVLVRREEGGYRFALVDINRMRFEPVDFDQGCDAFGKLWAKEEELKLLAECYGALWGRGTQETLERIQRAALRVAQIKARKNRLKGVLHR